MQQKHFIQPTPNHALIAACQSISPFYVNWKSNLSISVEPSVKEAFAQIKDRPAIVCPNHASPDDVLAVFELSAKLHEQFYFLTTREIFRWHPSIRSTWLQELGCYSIMRSAPDVQSYRMSLSLLTSGANKILIFPEGEISQANEALLPFELGAAHLTLQASLQKSERKEDPSVFLAPLAVLYRFPKEELVAIAELLAEVETRLLLKANGSTSQRLHKCFSELLAVNERQSNRQVSYELSIQQRIKEHTAREIRQLASEYSIDLKEDIDAIEKLHVLKNHLTERRYCEGVEPTEQVKHDYKRIVRLTALQAISDDSFHALMTQEHAFELLRVLSIQLDLPIDQPHKVAFFAATEPIDVAPLIALFQADRKSAIIRLRSHLREAIADTLSGLMKRHRSLTLVP